MATEKSYSLPNYKHLRCLKLLRRSRTSTYKQRQLKISLSSPTRDRKPKLSNVLPDESATPSASGKRTFLDSKRRKRNKSGSNIAIDCESEYETSIVTSNTAKTVGVSGRKRRNSWRSLKEIVESDGKGDGRTNGNTVVPFVL